LAVEFSTAFLNAQGRIENTMPALWLIFTIWRANTRKNYAEHRKIGN